jgi:hypothetical protein
MYKHPLILLLNLPQVCSSVAFGKQINVQDHSQKCSVLNHCQINNIQDSQAPPAADADPNLENVGFLFKL